MSHFTEFLLQCLPAPSLPTTTLLKCITVLSAPALLPGFLCRFPAKPGYGLSVLN